MLRVLSPIQHRRERGVNVLLMTVLGIIASLVFLGWGSASYLNGIDSAKTKQVQQTLLSIAAKIQQYENDTGSYPSVGQWSDPIFAMPTYFSVTPCDPIDTSCTPTSSSSDFAFQCTSDGNCAVFSTSHHPTSTLNGVPHWNNMAPFSAPPSTCGSNNCSEPTYSTVYGMEAW